MSAAETRNEAERVRRIGRPVVLVLARRRTDKRATPAVTFEFIDGETISQLSNEFVALQTFGQLTHMEFVDGQTIDRPSALLATAPINSIASMLG